AVADERELRVLRIEDAGLERDRLPVARDAAGFQPDLLELALDVRRGLFEPGRPDVPALEAITGEEDDARPPALPLDGRRVEDEGGDSKEYEPKCHDARHGIECRAPSGPAATFTVRASAAGPRGRGS